MQNNHSKNGTIFETCHGGTLAAVRALLVEHVQLDHGRPGIKAPDALVREALDRRLVQGEEIRDGPLCRGGLHSRQNYSPP